MVHLRVVTPEDLSGRILDLLCRSPAVTNVVRLPAAAHKPEGDLILCDIAREDASVIIGDLKDLGVPERGSIAVELIDSSISTVATSRYSGARASSRALNVARGLTPASSGRAVDIPVRRSPSASPTVR